MRKVRIVTEKSGDYLKNADTNKGIKCFEQSTTCKVDCAWFRIGGNPAGQLLAYCGDKLIGEIKSE